MWTRRALLQLGASVGGALVAGCKTAPPPVCTDETGLEPRAVQARRTLAYVDRAPDASRACVRCAQFLPKAEGCGGCRIFSGPISPAGSCSVFAPKA